MKNGQNSKNRCLIWRFWSWQGTLRVSGWMDFPFIFLSLSLSSHLLFSTSSIESTTSSLAILISIFIIQSRSLRFSGDFDLHLPHPISITPSSLSGLKDESVLSGGDQWLKTNRFGQERRWDWFDCAPQTWGRFGYDLFIFLVKVSNFWWPN